MPGFHHGFTSKMINENTKLDENGCLENKHDSVEELSEARHPSILRKRTFTLIRIIIRGNYFL